MYPDATFFGLIRDPVALYESHKRRRIVKSLGEFIKFYNVLANKMISDAESHQTYHIIRFEDLLREPAANAVRIYELAGLDPAKVSKLRFKAKPHRSTR